MPTEVPALVNFNAGELSPRLEGRVDLAKYNSGCRLLENFIPLVAGGALKRSGTRYIASAKDPEKPARLLEFAFSTEQTYILEFGDLYMRVYMDGAPVFSGGTPFELATPYLAADVASLFFAQSADVLYVAHPGYVPSKISRSAHDVWSITPIAFSPPPFSPENTNQTLRLWISASTGAGLTLNATSDLFTSTDVGRTIRLREVPEMMHRPWLSGVNNTASEQVVNAGNVYRKISGTGAATSTRPPTHDVLTQRELDGPAGSQLWELDHFNSGYVTITAFVSATEVTATATTRVPETYVGTADSDPGAYAHYERFRWSWGAFGGPFGYPRAVTFFEDRLWWAGTNGHPETMWGSRTGDYESHRTDDTDEGALSFTNNQGLVDVIHWFVPWRQLTIGTSGSEIIASALNPDEPITAVNPPNLNRNRSTYGSREGVAPVKVDNALLFVQRGGQKLRELMFDFNSDSYVASDMMLLSDHIALGRIKAIVYQQEPHRVLWACTDDGQLLALTYERQQQVVGWHRHPLGGTAAFVESVAVLHGSLQDEVWLAVRRTINGSSACHVERIEPEWERSFQIEDAFFLDSGLTYDGVPADVISGLDHLEGETVQVLADGAHHPDRVVSGGQITLAYEAGTVQVGLAFTAKLQTMKIEAGSANGTAQTRFKQINEVVFRLDQTGAGFFYGGEDDAAVMEQVYFRSSADPTGAPVPLFDGDTERHIWPAGYETEGKLTVHHRLPLPCTLLGIFPIVQTQER